MNPLGLVLLLIFLSSCVGELIISDEKNNEHMIVDENLTLIRKLDFKFNGRLRNVKVRKTEGGLVLYELEQSEISMYTVSNVGKVSKIGTIATSRNDKIDAFDVQPSGELVVMASGNKIYLFSQKDNKSTQILEMNYKAGVVFIHPTERIIYYADCSQKIGAPLNVYKMESNTHERRILLSCNFDIDFKKNIFWDTGLRRIVRQNLDGLSEIETSISDDVYTTSALSSEHLFFMRSEKKKEIYKLTTYPKLQKQMSLPEYAVEPVLSQIYGQNPVIFNVEKSFIEVLDPNFEKVINKIEIKVNAEPIKSLRIIGDDKSTTFFWIHDSNKGKVEYAHVVNNHVEKRDSFEVPTDGTDIIDFDIVKITRIFYFATETKIFKNYINILKPIGKYETPDLPFKPPIKAVGIQQYDNRLIVSNCGKSESGLAVIQIYLRFDLTGTLTNAPRCSNIILVDEQIKKANRIIASSSRGVFNLGFSDNEVELISSLKNISNLLLDGNNVYFVSRVDGPGIYKLDKRRTAKIDHNLPLADDGNFAIAKVKEPEMHKTKVPDIQPTTPIDITKYPGGQTERKDDIPKNAEDQSLSPQNTNLEQEYTTIKNNVKITISKSKGSKVTPPEEIILLLLIQVVAQIAPCW